MKSAGKGTTKLPKDLKFMVNKKVPYFGEVEVFRNESTQVQLLKKKILLNNASESTFGTLKGLATLKHSNLININEVKKLSEGEFEVVFEDTIDIDLLEETRHHSERGKRFSDREILEILKQLVAVVKFLHESNTPHGEITTKTILRGKNSQYKLLHPLFTALSNPKRPGEKKTKEQLLQSFEQDMESIGRALLEVYFFPEPIAFPLKSPAEIFKDYKPSTILEILLKLVDSQWKEIPNISALEKVLNSKETQEKVDKDDSEPKNKSDSRSPIMTFGISLNEQLVQENPQINQQQIPASNQLLPGQQNPIQNENRSQIAIVARTTSIRPPHPIFEHIYVLFNNGDIDDVRSPRGLTLTQQFFITHESMISLGNPGEEIRSDKRNQTLDQKLGDIDRLAISGRVASNLHASGDLSVYKSYNTPKNQNKLDSNQNIFHDTEGPSGNLEKNLPYQHKGLEMQKEQLQGTFGELSGNFKTPSKQDQPILLTGDEKLNARVPGVQLTATAKGGQSRPTDGRVNRTTTFASPEGVTRYAMVSSNEREKRNFLSNTNKFLLEAFSPGKNTGQPIVKILKEDLRLNPVSQVLKRSTCSFSNRGSPEKRISRREDMKELIDEFVHEDPNRKVKILPPLNHFEFTEANQSSYDGEMQGGKRHGRGKMTFKSGEHYEGEWKNNMMEGYGVLYDKNKNKIYEGHYARGKMEGSGILYNTNRSPPKISTEHAQVYKNFDLQSETWVKFEGVFRENKWEGIGKLFFSKGDMYYGEVREGMLHGNGCLYTEAGQVISQVWENNRLVVSDVLTTEGADFE